MPYEACPGQIKKKKTHLSKYLARIFSHLKFCFGRPLIAFLLGVIFGQLKSIYPSYKALPIRGVFYFNAKGLKMKKTFSQIIILLFSMAAASQTITFTQVGNTTLNIPKGIGTIDIANNWAINELDTFDYPIGGVGPLRALTYHPNGKLYVTATGGIYGFFYANFEQNIMEQDTNKYNFFYWMKTGPDGYIYGTSPNNTLSKLNIESGIRTELGLVGLEGAGNTLLQTHTFINGEHYACVADMQDWPFKRYFVKINHEDPLNSKIIMELPFTSVISGITTFNLDCDSSITYLARAVIPGTYEVYQLNIKEPSVSFVTTLTFPTAIGAFANPSEYLQFDCTPILDLDEQDLAGTPGLHFKAPKTCVNPSQPVLPFSGSHPAILTNTIVDSVWVGIVSGQADGSDEKLGSYGNITSTSSNGGIMLYNAAQSSNPVFMQELKQAVFYQNEAQAISEGVRKLAVVPFNNNYPGDTAFLSLPVLAGFNAAGTVTHPNAANTHDGSIEINIVGSGYEYLWSNGQTTQNLTSLSSGNYTVTITAENGCSTEMAFTLEVINETRDEKLNPLEAAIIPNPSGSAGAVLQLKTPVNGLSWRVFDATGKKVAQGKSYGTVTKLPTGLPVGLYHIELMDGLKRSHLRWMVGYE